MSSIKKLASQTAYYGLSSVLGRMLNYALVPIHTRVLTHQQDYGVIGELYAYVSFLNIIFLCGMETAFFRFVNKEDKDPRKVYNTAFTLVLILSMVLSLSMVLFSNDIITMLTPSGLSQQSIYKSDYVVYFAVIMALDAVAAVPFALLRHQNRPKKFAFIKILNISVNVILNVYFLLVCPTLYHSNPSSLLLLGFSPDNMIAYVFISNLVASAMTIVFLYKEVLLVKLQLLKEYIRPMLKYALPLLVAGLAGMTNETLDRILLKYCLSGSLDARLAQIGVYNAAYKLSIFMTLAVQAFRMAAEPFFFSMHKQEDAKQVYAKVMDYFVLVCAIIYVGVTAHLDVLAYILGEKYREGLGVVPILLMANLCLGVYLNLSIWYKLSDKTYWGIYLTLIGAVITIAANLYWIPLYGYYGSAWATLLSYSSMALICYVIGQKYYKVPYHAYILVTIVGAVVVFAFNKYIVTALISNLWWRQAVLSTMFISIVAGIFFRIKSRLKAPKAVF